MNAGINPFSKLATNEVTSLEGCDHFEAADHHWSQSELDALTLAFAARRPLLVRGEPGSGKSQLARAAAAVLGSGSPIVEVIHPRFEASDLLYRFDAIARLSDAQLRGADGQSAALDPTNRKYVTQGALWRSFEHARGGAVRPVLLIDEIDKADADLPNSLLDVLGNRSFDVPMLQAQNLAGAGDARSLRVEAPDVMPLIVITTNEERELPAAFVRRCVVLNVSPPKNDAELSGWLLERVLAHRNLRDHLSVPVVERAIAQVLADRYEASRQGYPRVGLAELVDLLSALREITEGVPSDQRESAQQHWLDRLGAYALVKHAGQDQRRPVVSAKA